MLLRIKWFIILLFTETFKSLKYRLTGIWLKAWKKAIEEKYKK